MSVIYRKQLSDGINFHCHLLKTHFLKHFIPYKPLNQFYSLLSNMKLNCNFPFNESICWKLACVAEALRKYRKFLMHGNGGKLNCWLQKRRLNFILLVVNCIVCSKVSRNSISSKKKKKMHFCKYFHLIIVCGSNIWFITKSEVNKTFTLAEVKINKETHKFPITIASLIASITEIAFIFVDYCLHLNNSRRCFLIFELMRHQINFFHNFIRLFR